VTGLIFPEVSVSVISTEQTELHQMMFVLFLLAGYLIILKSTVVKIDLDIRSVLERLMIVFVSVLRMKSTLTISSITIFWNQQQ